MKNKKLKKCSLFANKLFFLLFFSYTLQAQDENIRFDRSLSVHVRDQKGNLSFKLKTLPHLTSYTHFIGKNFTIHYADEQNPISFSTQPELLTRAATVYYHLETALHYFNTTLKPLPIFKQKNPTLPIVVRIEMTKPYSDISHFEQNGSQLFNTSLTIAASDPDIKDDALSDWGTEILFYKAHPEKRMSLGNQVATLLNQRSFKNMILQQLTYPEVLEIGREFAFGYEPFWPAHLASLATSVLVTETFVPLLGLMTKPFKSTHWLDTAMIPEIIYHELGHVLFEPHLGLFRPTPIVEGYPNYFASQVSGLKNLADNGKKFIKNRAAKRSDSQELYSLNQEVALMAATGSFTYSLLSQLNEIFGTQSDRILYGALAYLDRSSDLRSDFTKAILKSILSHSQEPLAHTLAVQHLLQERGF